MAGGPYFRAESDPAWKKGAENVGDWKDGLSLVTKAAGSADHKPGSGDDSVLAWQWDATEGNLENLFGQANILEYIGHHSEGVTNLVQLHAWDADNDRANDQADSEITFATMMLTDDDATAPESPGYSLIGSGTNFVRFGKMAKWGNVSEMFGNMSVTQGMAASALVKAYKVGFAGPVRNDTSIGLSRYSSAPGDFFISGSADNSRNQM